MTNYAELHAHSCYSLLDGASTPETLLQRAFEMGMEALALTDHDAVYGAVQFDKAARARGIHPIFGAELTLAGEDDQPHHLTLLVQNSTGWNHLCALITAARHNAPKGKALLPPGVLEQHTDGLIALSGCKRGEIGAALRRDRTTLPIDIARRYIDWFGREHYFIELQHHLLPHDDRYNERLAALAQQVGVGVVATNNVHYATRDAYRLQDVMVCIRNNTTFQQAGRLRRPNSEYYLKSCAEMTVLFADYPDAIANSMRIAERCDFALDFGLQELPIFPTPDGMSAYVYLEQLCREGLRTRRIDTSEAVEQQFAHELAVIGRAGLSNYFLIVWDIVRFARAQGIRCQGRGSAANSLVAYLLAISPVNPLETNLLFERFLSDERRATPDIDIDFDAARREEVIQYVYERYGIAHAGMACTLVTFRAKSALRDVGKALGLPADILDRAASVVDTYNANEIAASPGFVEAVGEQRAGDLWRQLVELCAQIDGMPRHLGIHNGGMILMGVPLARRLPTEPATMKDRYVVQWDKDSLEDAGLVKVDILGLRMLAAISEALTIVEAQEGTTPDLDHMTFDDPHVYSMITHTDTIGVFQVESRAQSQILPRVRPKTFNDLFLCISVMRPGPVQGNMVNPLMRRVMGVEPVTYPHPLLEAALKESYGVVLYQEQVAKIARDLAGFTPGEGEQLRRTLGKRHALEAINRLYQQFIEGAMRKGVERATADLVWDTLKAFGGYSFPKSHAAAFSVIVYQSAWLKLYHPAAFYTALLNHQPMGYWSPQVLLNDAKRHRVAILPIDVNLSAGTCAVQDDAIRLGYNYVKGFGEAAIERVMAARSAGDFDGLRDFCRRTQLPVRVIERLILSGGFDRWNPRRRELVWELGKLDYRPGTLDLVYGEDDLTLPKVSLFEVMGIEFEMMGVSLREHVMSFFRASLQARKIRTSSDLASCEEGRTVRIAGQQVDHNAPPTAKGFHFLALEDEFGMVNVIVRPNVYADYRSVIRSSPYLIVSGAVQRENGITNIIAEEVIPLQVMP